MTYKYKPNELSRFSALVFITGPEDFEDNINDVVHVLSPLFNEYIDKDKNKTLKQLTDEWLDAKIDTPTFRIAILDMYLYLGKDREPIIMFPHQPRSLLDFKKKGFL